jgi:hypothetical protein
MATKPKRKAVSQKVRFEVFKRDSFCCQYCGQSAPDVILEVDHIKPVAGGGDNDITNLITSCRDCNNGKGARPLDDKSVMEKQRKQLEELNERRNQLEMMLKWREGLLDITKVQIDVVADAIASKSHFALNDNGRRDVSAWLKKYPLQDLLDAVDSSFEQKLLTGKDGVVTGESWNEAYILIPKYAAVNKSTAGKPYLKDLFYIRGIIRNRLPRYDQHKCLSLLERAVVAGSSIESLREFAKTVRTWADFVSEMEGFLEAHEEVGP